MSKDSNNPTLVDIYREVGETKVSVEGISSKLDNHVEYSLTEFSKINELDAEQNRILDKHIEGVNTLKQLYIEHRAESKEQIELLKTSLEVQRTECNGRLAALERPYDLVKFAGKVVVVLGGIIGAIWTILKFLKYLGVM